MQRSTTAADGRRGRELPLRALGERPWVQLAVGVPLGLLAASVAGITQVGIAYGLQGAQSWDDALSTPWPGQPIGMVLQVAAAILVMWFVATRIAGRPVYELERQGAIRELAYGGAIGAGIVTITVLLLLGVGTYEITDVTVGRGLLTGILLGLGSAFGEEVVMRGILLRVLIGKLGTAAALAITSLAFGLLHLGNPHSSLLGAVGVALQAGLLFGAAYLLTRRLWLAIGIHAAWNFTQTAIFGLNVSGVPTEPGLLVARLQGPEWLSGGEVGIEGSVITIALGLIVSLVMLRAAIAKKPPASPS
ncbi:MAG: CPBP family intramembrane metalloprotease [Actinobacteria bacterium]|nr:CPBP family intramembrane metalloprotease [Actinomycetota bacterium]